MSISYEDAVQSIIDAGRRLDVLHLAPAGGGNYSVRLDPNEIAITVSGVHKGQLEPEHIMRTDLEGNPLDDKKPSAETLLHCALYKIHPNVNAVLHTHSVACTALTRFLAQDDHMTLEGYEMLKAFPNIETHDTAVTLPVFDNTQDMQALSKQVSSVLKEKDQTPAFLIRGHGLYGWGRDMTEARHVIEAVEMLLSCEMHMRQMKK